MSEQTEIQTPEPPKKPPFQFGLKHLLALPVVVALFFGVAAVTGYAAAVIVSLFAIGVAGMLSAATRPVAAILLFVSTVAIVIVPAIQVPVDGGGSRGTCMNNLKNIALALRCYEEKHGCFPPAHISDEDGRPMHSWRVLILPFLERTDLWRAYSLDEPWDGPNNYKLADIDVGFFRCPGEPNTLRTMTNYVLVVGPTTPFPGTQQTSLKDSSDGPSQTILLVEVASSGIHWMEPRDLHVEEIAPIINPTAGQGISSLHPGGAHAAFVDGSVRFLPDNTSAQRLRAMLTRPRNITTNRNDPQH